MVIDIIVYGDQHLDLKTEGIDRTDDILDAHKQITDYAIDLKNNGNEVICLNMGDMFHGTRPRAEVIAKAIAMLNVLESNEIETHIIAGNHDIIDARSKTSALEPLVAIGYRYINIHHTVHCRVLRPGLNLITLPHISKAFAVEQGFKNVQDALDSWATQIEQNLPDDQYNIIIGHMNIEGAKTGTESYMIKGSHEDFPKVLKHSPKINIIFNGHIHRSQLIPNEGGAPIIITGDIQCNDFGERLDQKQFFHLEVEI